MYDASPRFPRPFRQKQIPSSEPFGFIPVDAGGGGAQAGERGDARGIADRRGDVGVGEEQAAFREPVDVRRLHLRMTAETAHPVVHVVHDDHEDVGRW